VLSEAKPGATATMAPVHPGFASLNAGLRTDDTPGYKNPSKQSIICGLSRIQAGIQDNPQNAPAANPGYPQACHHFNPLIPKDQTRMYRSWPTAY